MAAQILDGKSLAAQIRTDVKRKVSALVQRGMRPGLAVILAGDDPASPSTCETRRAPARKPACARTLIELPASVSEGELLERVAML